jgi:hypothetical protein
MALDSANETVARINKFAIAVLTGEARTPMPGDTPGDRDVASENAAPFLEMQARISEEQFMAEWRKMMMEMHNSEPES